MDMIDQPLFILKLFVALGCGLTAGVFFAFSSFVMPALTRLQPPQGIAAMQSINITAINPWFMTVLFGPAIACLVLLILILPKGHSGAVYLLTGSVIYLIGTIGVTIACNVPLNNALAIVQPDSPEGASLWAKYLSDWTFWNHIRTIAALAATTLLTIGLR